MRHNFFFSRQLSFSILVATFILCESVAAIAKADELRISPPPHLTQANRREEAEKLVTQAVELFQSQATAATLQQVITKFEAALAIWREIDDPAKTAETLGWLGIVYRRLDESGKAGEYHTQALALYRALQDKLGEATTLSFLGGIHSDLGEPQEALDYYQQALKLFNNLEQDYFAANALWNIATIWAGVGETDKALEHYQQALRLQQELGASADAANTLFGIGTLYTNLGQHQQAISALQQALELHETLAAPQGKARILITLASAYPVQESQQALASLSQALEIARNQGDLILEVQTLQNIGTIYTGLSDYSQAAEYHNQALDIARQVGLPELTASILETLGITQKNWGDYPRSLKAFHQAREIYQTSQNPVGEANTLYLIGEIHLNRGDYQLSLDTYNQGLQAMQTASNRRGEADFLFAIAGVYEQLNDGQNSINYYQQALDIYQGIGDLTNTIFTLGELGEIYALQQEYERSLDYYQQALEASRGSNSSLVAINLISIGKTYKEQKKYDQAIDYYNQALDIVREQNYPLGEAGVLAQLGGLNIDAANYDQAFDFLHQALPIVEALESPSSQANLFNTLARAYAASGDTQQSRHFYQQELAIWQTLGNAAAEAESLYNLARREQEMGNLPAALQRIEAALEVVENLRTNVDIQELRTSFFASKQDYYEFYIDLLMQLHQQNPGDGYDALALQASERARARSLLEILNEAHTDIRQGVDAQLVSREQRLQEQIEAIEQRLVELVSGKYTEEQKANLDRQRETLYKEYQQVQRQIRATSPRYAALTQPQPLNLSQIQAQVLDEDSLLLEYFLGEKRSYLWVVSKTGITSYELPPSAQIEAAVKKLRSRLTSAISSNQRVFATAAPLSEMILAPAAEKLGNKRLLIVADGALQYIPFAALPIPTKSNEYAPLITAHEIVNLPSASTLALQRQETRDRITAPHPLAILADPVFNGNDARANAVQSETNLDTLPITTLQATRAATDFDINWQRLPGTRQEAQAILDLVPEDMQTTFAFDFQANKATVTSPELANYRIIHLATHGFANDQNPEFSGIVMSLINEQGKVQNGFLHLEDIFNLNLPAELVVLSACQTGLGKQIRGEGLVGLTRGLMYAGAQRIVTSLWRVSDAGTPVLMTKFYQGMLQQGLTPAAALRAAQLQMWKEGEFSNPYFWSAFTLQGEWY